MKDIGIIGSADGPTSVFISSDDENFLKSGGIVEEDNTDTIGNDTIQNNTEKEIIEENLENSLTFEELQAELNSRTLAENLDAGLKIMGIGMVAVFGVLTILYIVIKIMGQFAKSKKDNDSNEKN